MLGICIPCSRILDITKDIADCMLQQNERDKVVLSEILRISLLKIILILILIQIRLRVITIERL